ncbi:MAG: methionine--tRNA ligase [Coriobacteriales bacterium]|nr:methionine--tRNA ligase [Coriobacteriales bacterium]
MNVETKNASDAKNASETNDISDANDAPAALDAESAPAAPGAKGAKSSIDAECAPAAPDANDASFYLTTPIYYVNGEPHLGTAYTTIAADALARAMRMADRDVWMLTGLDEHGQKVAQKAEEAGVSPQEWVDSIAPKFKQAWEELNISYDDFIRTTEERHTRGVQQFFQTLYDNGYIYKSNYEGFYCLPDETFFTDEALAEFAEQAAAGATQGRPATDEDGKKLCPDCGRPLSYVQEENLFFKLSSFEEKLLAYYEANPKFIQPEIRRNEVLSFVRGGLKDLSVSRTTFDWGVPIPFAPGHVSYVWVDALINYITAVGYGDSSLLAQENFAKRWPVQVHFVGKDIIRFHCVIWPAMLMAAGLEPPKQVFAHGFLLTKGEKMSKSRGNALSPAELCEVFSVDGYRYYFLTDVQFGADGSISLERMAQVYNADLANSWGNLCSRAFNMTNKYFDGLVPELSSEVAAALTEEMGNPLQEIAASLYKRYYASIEALDYSGAMAAVQELVAAANLYVENSAPWALAKSAQLERLSFVMYNILETIRIAAVFFAPVMPNTSAEVWRRLGLDSSLMYADAKKTTCWGGLPAGNRVEVGDPLFPRKELSLI